MQRRTLWHQQLQEKPPGSAERHFFFSREKNETFGNIWLKEAMSLKTLSPVGLLAQKRNAQA